MRYHKNTKTLINLHCIFQENWQFLTRLRAINYTNWARIGTNSWIVLKNKVLANFTKRAQRYQHWIERYEFFKKRCSEFSTLHHLPSKCDISTTLASNRTRLGLLETRHPKLSMHIQFKENGARKGLQTAT